ncbi:MAG: (2Fe-2S)-binding protein [Alphaproteobacteria bacterium]|nr:(2Fe-2S)-binding protein [Alphaproteobacteria bacterium]
MPDDPKSKPPKFSLTRRTFLKSAGLASAGAASVGLLEDLAAQQTSPVQGPDAVPVTLSVDGEQRRLNVEPRTTLAEALRDELHLTGTKIVCDRGACSACTVMLDNVPVASCMTLAIDAQARKIRTIESLGQADKLHPVQAAFIEHDGMQCGFCTPGMVMSCTHLVESNPHPSDADVRQAISGNICRCGTYPKVIAAVLSATNQKSEA